MLPSPTRTCFMCSPPIRKAVPGPSARCCHGGGPPPYGVGPVVPGSAGDRRSPAGAIPIAPCAAHLGRTWELEDLVECDGRVESVSLSGRAFISLAGPLFESHPPREIRLVAIKWFVNELAQCPHLAQIERLNLAGNQIGYNGIRTLAGSPFLRASFLDLTNNNLGPEGVAALLSAPWNLHVRELKLSGNGLKPNDIDGLRSALSPLTVDTIA